MVLLLLAVQLEAGQELQRCGLSKAVWYCSKECQKRDWRAGHKEACRGRVGEEAAAPAGSSRSAGVRRCQLVTIAGLACRGG